MTAQKRAHLPSVPASANVHHRIPTDAARNGIAANGGNDTAAEAKVMADSAHGCRAA